MTDLELAKEALAGHTIALCRNGDVITSDKRGVAPMVDFIREGRDLDGYSAADLVVGRAAAMLFISAEIRELHAKVLSSGAKALLDDHGISVSFDTLTEQIVNREGTGPCPMERAVSGTDDIREGVSLIGDTLDRLRAKNQNKKRLPRHSDCILLRLPRDFFLCGAIFAPALLQLS